MKIVVFEEDRIMKLSPSVFADSQLMILSTCASCCSRLLQGLYVTYI